jgi:glycosyltransferase involved in cell wall biosynthesis
MAQARATSPHCPPHHRPTMMDLNGFAAFTTSAGRHRGVRILHFLGTRRLPSDPEREAVGGVTRVALELARAQRRVGHQTWVVTTGPEAWSGAWMGVTLRSLKWRRWATLELGSRRWRLEEELPLMALTRSRRFDVVHGHELTRMRFVRAGMRIVHLHNDDFGERGTERFERKAHTFWSWARGCDAQIGVSEFLVEALRASRSVAGEPGADSIFRVPNGADLDRFGTDDQLERERLRHEWGVKETNVVFLFAGAVAPQKGLRELGQAFSAISQELPEARLVIAGGWELWGDTITGPSNLSRRYGDSVREALAGPASRGQVIALGLVPPERIPAVHRASDVLVVPSVVGEGFGLSIIEAMAAGRPVVGSRIGAIPELVKRANGELVPPGDTGELARAMTRLARDPELRQRMGAQARLVARGFSWHRAAEILDQLYAQVGAGRLRP